MKKQLGFTLIELMIVVAIIAVIAGIALPSYQEHVKTSRRADAQGALLGLAQAMEQHFTENGTYAGAADGNGVPSIFADEAPLDGGTKFYNLRVTASDGSSYTLQAQAKNAQADDGDLQLRSTGEKGWDRGDDGTFGAGDMCWNKSCS
ncbi:prepilin-type N-terminal cleavage/methylation domain-containing protein [Microbulbifer sp. SH-1]|uniref:type IV pilin protein n=1 Tax=Microbulbifer sp. SH-1 TaxID=2681547 RepID=UPI00140A5683|nr:type IV pilin protein [Microbulbifer sp. SH-1]QIL91514.1 prepilin-type N-terminal cleavage/methylation domain-containing protein [Microbulbifer sp. SH-1]